MSATTSRQSSRSQSGIAARRLLLLATAASVTLAFVPGAAAVIYPIRLFSTIVHEGGHALMTLFTLGHVEGIVIRPNASGVTTSAGGIGPLIYMAGYLGAAVFGAIGLHLTRRPGSGQRTLALLGALVIVVTAAWIHPWNSPFGFLAGLVVGGLLMVASRALPEPGARFAAAFLAVQLSLNALYDVRDLVWMTTHTGMENDAVFMSQHYGLVPWFWAVVWAAASAAILAASLRSYWRASR